MSSQSSALSRQVFAESLRYETADICALTSTKRPSQHYAAFSSLSRFTIRDFHVLEWGSFIEDGINKLGIIDDSRLLDLLHSCAAHSVYRCLLTSSPLYGNETDTLGNTPADLFNEM